MKKALSLALSIIAIFLLSSCASIKSDTPRVCVTGSSEVMLSPDIAKFRVSAESTKETTEEARAATSKMLNEALSILEHTFAISKDDIVTSYMNVSPSYSWKDDKRVIDGQCATGTISVTLHDIDKYGTIFEALSKIDGISVSNAELDKLDKSDDIEKARVLAIEAAYDKANTYAQASGMRIKSILSISDGSYDSYSYSNAMLSNGMMYKAESSTMYYVGKITISDSVTVVYELEKQ